MKCARPKTQGHAVAAIRALLAWPAHGVALANRLEREVDVHAMDLRRTEGLEVDLGTWPHGQPRWRWTGRRHAARGREDGRGLSSDGRAFFSIGCFASPARRRDDLRREFQVELRFAIRLDVAAVDFQKRTQQNEFLGLHVAALVEVDR